MQPVLEILDEAVSKPGQGCWLTVSLATPGLLMGVIMAGKLRTPSWLVGLLTSAVASANCASRCGVAERDLQHCC